MRKKWVTRKEVERINVRSKYTECMHYGKCPWEALGNLTYSCNHVTHRKDYADTGVHTHTHTERHALPGPSS